MYVVKWGKRNVLSRPFHAKDKKKAIAAWKIDLGQIRRVLNVSPFPCFGMVLPTFSSKTELATIADSNIGAPGARPDILNTHVATSRTHHDAMYPNLVVSEPWGAHPDGIHTTSSTHYNTLEYQGDVGGQDRAVGTTRTTSIAERLLITA